MTRKYKKRVFLIEENAKRPHLSELNRKRWADPEYRAKRAAELKQRWQQKWYRDKVLNALRDPESMEKSAIATRSKRAQTLRLLSRERKKSQDIDKKKEIMSQLGIKFKDKDVDTLYKIIKP